MNADQLKSMQAPLKQKYKDGLAVIGYKKSPFMAMLHKDTEMTGSSREVPLLYGAPTGRSCSISPHPRSA